MIIVSRGPELFDARAYLALIFAQKLPQRSPYATPVSEFLRASREVRRWETEKTDA